MKFSERISLKSKGSWLDFLASSRGFVATMVVTMLLGLLIIRWVNESTQVLRDNVHEMDMFSSSRVHAAINDIIRLSSAVQEGSAYGWNDYSRQKVQVRLDVLRQRALHVEKRLADIASQGMANSGEAYSESLQVNGRNAARSLRGLIRASEDLLDAAEFSNRFQHFRFTNAVELARTDVFRYLNQVMTVQSDLNTRQSEKIETLSVVVLFYLVALGTAVAIGLLLLRKEVTARKLRDQAESRAWQLAYFDQVTGLPNRAQFTEVVDEALERQEKCSLVLVDLDYFKDVNDQHGHLIGDEVLIEFARRLQNECRENNALAARLGGDEFAVFVRSDNLKFLKHFLDALQDVCRTPMVFEDISIIPSFSAGMAATSQISVTRKIRMEEFMRVADFALYASKAAGRGCYTIYDTDLDAQLSTRRDLVAAMPEAVKAGEMVAFLQPKVDLVTLEPHSFEALVRWNRHGKILPPSDFISVAEETGMILEIDRYILEVAVGEVAAWNEKHGTQFSISVNLSALHFRGDRDFQFVYDALKRHNFPPHLLTLEITETVQLANWSQVVPILTELREHGCRISIDDFGAGFSSLAYLRMIQADELKIDRTLVSEIEDSDQAQFILDAVLELAHHLGLKVVVEGIETESQLQRVREMGCRVGQGYFFSPPVPANDALVAASAGLEMLSVTRA